MVNSVLQAEKRLAEMKRKRAEKMMSLYENGKTLEEIADKFEVTRQRVQQILRVEHPDRYLKVRIDAVVNIHQRQIKRDKARHRVVICRVCGEEFETTNILRIYCSKEHQQAFVNYFRRLINPERTRDYIARSNLNNPKASKRSKQLAKEQLARNHVPNRIYLYSNAKCLAIQAYKENWPIFKEFDQTYQDYVIQCVEEDV